MNESARPRLYRDGFDLKVVLKPVWSVGRGGRAIAAGYPRSCGYTLVEVMIVVALIAIIASVAVRSGKNMLANRLITGTANAFLSALDYARAAAVSRAQTVVICPSRSGTACGDKADWPFGWLIWVDLDNNGELNGNDEVLAAKNLEGQLTLDVPTSIESGFQFGANGRPSVSQQSTVAVCDERGVIEQARAIILTVAGRGSVLPIKEAGVTTCQS